jgi:hypothetical protein
MDFLVDSRDRERKRGGVYVEDRESLGNALSG